MPVARLYLVTPIVADASAFAATLSEACAMGDVAAVLLRLADADDRTMINRLKLLAPIAQQAGAAAGGLVEYLSSKGLGQGVWWWRQAVLSAAVGIWATRCTFPRYNTQRVTNSRQ